jgi:hypothetical protein
MRRREKSEKEDAAVGRVMSKFILSALAAAAIAIGMPVVVSAAPSTPLYANHVPRAETVQKADYYWHHRHWHHRRWDRHHRWWRYYN